MPKGRQTGDLFRAAAARDPSLVPLPERMRPRMNDVADDFLLFVLPFGNYLDLDTGIRCQTSSWRRVPDTSIPARAKVNAVRNARPH